MKDRITASIITIGDELLIGQVIDTNSAVIAQELNKIGIWVARRVAVGDIYEDIRNAVDAEAKTADIVLLTGGLGPTKDDITKNFFCQYFNTKLVTDTAALENVKRIFAGRDILQKNLSQADVPEACKVLQNSCGTAPGMWFEQNGKIIISMPGVPYEMKSMMSEKVIPLLTVHFSLPFIYHRTLLTAGQGESVINDRIKDWESALPNSIRLAYLPDLGKVRLRLTAYGTDQETIKSTVDNAFEKLKVLLSDIAVSENGESLEEMIGKLLKAQNRTIGTAESCTAGYIAHVLSSIPGASDYLKGGIVSYSNEIKARVLGVQQETLNTKGAVSEETVRQMVTGVMQVLNVDTAVAVSGILGPGGGSEEKPVGTVWIAVANRQKIIAKKFHFHHNRERNMQLTTVHALNMVFHMLTNMAENK